MGHFPLPAWLTNLGEVPWIIPAFQNSQKGSENELELVSKAASHGHNHSSARPAKPTTLPREQLMHQAAKDLPDGVDPAHKEVGTGHPCSQCQPEATEPGQRSLGLPTGANCCSREMRVWERWRAEGCREESLEPRNDSCEWGQISGLR